MPEGMESNLDVCLEFTFMGVNNFFISREKQIFKGCASTIRSLPILSDR